MPTGGLGAAVASLVAQNQPVPMRILGVDRFAPTGSTEFLLEHFGLTADGIAAAVREILDHGRS
jgi:transketolase